MSSNPEPTDPSPEETNMAADDTRAAPEPAGPELTIEMDVLPSARAAIEYAAATGGRAVRMGNLNLVLSPDAAERLTVARAPFYYLHLVGDRVSLTPVNQ